MRSSDDHEGSMLRSDQRFRANPAHLFHPRETSSGSGGQNTTTTKQRPSTADSLPGEQAPEAAVPFAQNTGAAGTRRRHGGRLPAPQSGPMTAGNGNGSSVNSSREGVPKWGSWERLSEGRGGRGEEPPPGAPVGGGGRSGAPPPPLPDSLHQHGTKEHSDTTLPGSPTLDNSTTGSVTSSPQHAQHMTMKARIGRTSRTSDAAAPAGSNANTQAHELPPQMHAPHEFEPYTNPDSRPQHEHSEHSLPYPASHEPPSGGAFENTADTQPRVNAVDNPLLNNPLYTAPASIPLADTPPRERRITTPGSAHPYSWTTNAVSMLSPRKSETVTASSSRRHWWSQATPEKAPSQSPTQRHQRPLGPSTLPERNIFNAALNTASADDLFRTSRRKNSSSGLTSGATTDRTAATLTPPASHSSRMSRPRSRRSAEDQTDPFPATDAATTPRDNSNSLHLPVPSIIATAAIATAEDEDSSYSPIGEAVDHRARMRTPPRRRGTNDRHLLPRPNTAPFAMHSHNSCASDYEPPDPWGVNNLMGGAFGSRPSWASGGRERAQDDNRISPGSSHPPAWGVKHQHCHSGSSGLALGQSHTAPPSPLLSPGGDITEDSADAPRVFVSRLRGVASVAAGVVPSHPVETPSSLSGSAGSSSKGGFASGSGSAGAFVLPGSRPAGWIPPGPARK